MARIPPQIDPHSDPAQAPSPWVMRYLPGIREGGALLDIACGAGRHLRAGAAAGFSVTGIDRDISRACELKRRSQLENMPDVELIEADLETGGPLPFEGRQWDGVVVTNYLWRPIMPAIIAAVAPAGVLIYETFSVGNERYGKPSNPQFLLQPGELLTAVAPQLTPIAYEMATVTTGGDSVKQRIAAVGPEHRWLTQPPAGLSIEKS